MVILSVTRSSFAGKASLLHRCLATQAGTINQLQKPVRDFVQKNADLCNPDAIHVCDGTEKENDHLLKVLMEKGMIAPIKSTKYRNCWIAKTDPKDVARVESKTVMVTDSESETRPTTKPGATPLLNIWMSKPEFKKQFDERFPGCMKGHTMYVLPFSMGPIGSPLSKIGIQCTDSPYVAVAMRIMTRLSSKVLDTLGNSDDFTKCLHSVGQPLPSDRPMVNNWPCNPDKVIVAHIPDENRIASFGSGYGGNSLIGKKCFALRIASCLARDEGWLAEHMLIMAITNPKGVKKYIAAAFPSACGKTNLAMMEPTIPGWKVECVGDDIAWMRFDKQGNLRAINPEAGFFGVVPGTSYNSNPFAMKTLAANSVFTNCATRSDGDLYWEGCEEEVPPGVTITSWKNQPWDIKTAKEPSSHPNSRFCCPAAQCPIMDPLWESPDGVPIEGILFGGRRPEGVPLVYQAFDWNHGVFIGASMRSEATAAAEHKSKVVMHDPFAMRPFFGYNFGTYLKHWLSFGLRSELKLPSIFHVNWFRKNAEGKFIWPGYGENSRALEWIFNRISGADVARKSAIGYLPKDGTINTDGLKGVDMKELFTLPKDFWKNEVSEIEKYLDEQVNKDLPQEMWAELNALKERVNSM